MRAATRQSLRLSGGTELSFITAGEASKSAVLLLHGFPTSARIYVIAPDLPGRNASWASSFKTRTLIEQG